MGKTSRDMQPSKTERCNRLMPRAQPDIQAVASAIMASSSQKRLSNSSMPLQVQLTSHFIQSQFGRSQHKLSAVESLCIPARGVAFHPAQPHEREKCTLFKPRLNPL